MEERLQKILSGAGLCSRRRAEEWIRAGRLSVNGKTAVLGARADPETDTITLDGKPIRPREKSVYILLHKPRGVVTTLSDEHGRKTVADLVRCGTRVYPVGRLDYLSEGLLLLTNDGAMANAVAHPSGEISKVYRVTLRGVTDTGLKALAGPLMLDGYRLRSAKVKLLQRSGDTCEAEITIYEGRNRQIRRMAELCGMTVVRLIRVQEGPLHLGSLPRGQWRYLTAKEISALQAEFVEKQ